MSEDKFNAYGDISVEYVNIKIKDTELSLLNVYQGLNIYEDIFSPFITGDITFLDSNNLIKNLNITGGEDQVISYKFKTAGSQFFIEGNLSIYKVGERVRINENTYTYKLYLISKEAFDNNKKLISRSFKGLYSDNVKALVKELNTDKEVLITDSVYPISWISMNWKPIEAINWICTRALFSNSNTPSFIFFETQNGFVFDSIENIISKESEFKYTVKPVYSQDELNNHNDIFFNPRIVKINHSSNLLNPILDGSYGATIINHDIVSKTIDEETFNFSDFKHISENGLTDLEYFGSKNYYGPKHSNRTNYPGDNKIGVGKRSSLLGSLNTSNLTISISFNSQITVGKMLFLDIQSPESKDVINIKDGHIYGDHLISNLAHNITPENGETTLELLKDSIYAEEIL